MEHAQRGHQRQDYRNGTGQVLILILMEHAQRVDERNDKTLGVVGSLNPYFNGTCSKRKTIRGVLRAPRTCLNPYFNGTCSKSTRKSCGQKHNR